MAQVAREHERLLAPLTNDLPLVDSGLQVTLHRRADCPPGR
jgi:hypothetical protein